MNPRCTCCAHAESFAINHALVVERSSERTVADRFDLSKTAVHRHKHHIPELLLEGSRAQDVADADLILDDLERIRASALTLLDKAERTGGAWRAQVAAIREARENIRILGELQGKLAAQG